MTPRHPSRRAVAWSLGASLLAWPRWAAAQSAADRGIGGTGVAAPAPGEDRGIGGTGVIGTIRRFGSIIVNDLRIAYGEDTVVTIDGRRAATGDLKVGQVVRVAALAGANGLMTERINVTSEVVGPVEHCGANHLVVLGQMVVAGDGASLAAWPLGRFVAVSGLRRPDGAIVASLVERARRRTPRLSGILSRGRDGTLRIGRLVIRGVDPTFAGQRVSVNGPTRGGVLMARGAILESSLLQALRTERLSLEAYVARSGDAVMTGTGLTADDTAATSPLPDNDVVRAVVSGSLDPRGHMVVDRIEALNREGHRASGAGPGGPTRSGPFGGGGAPPGGGTGPSGGHPGGPPGGGPPR